MTTKTNTRTAIWALSLVLLTASAARADYVTKSMHFDPSDSLPLRRRVNSGEVLGPTIFLAGSIFPANGRPAYLPPEMQLPEAATPEASERSGRYTASSSSLRYRATNRFRPCRAQKPRSSANGSCGEARSAR
jgi:hypothetical protein